MLVMRGGSFIREAGKSKSIPLLESVGVVNPQLSGFSSGFGPAESLKSCMGYQSHLLMRAAKVWEFSSKKSFDAPPNASEMGGQ